MQKWIGWRAFVVATVLVAGCPSTPEPMPGVDGGPIVRTDGGPPCATATDCDDGRFCNGPEVCDATSADADERGCAPGTLPCLADQRCSETEGRCTTICAVEPDADGDGADAMMCGGTDCDDADARRTPGGIEVCDAENRDEDCDSATFGSRDADGDTFVDAACCNGTGATMRCGNDCNDSRRDSHPGATEACEGIDNDCDGATDEGLTVMAWPDRDFDLHGIEDDSMRQEVCPGTPGYSQVSDDCDDASPVRHRAQLEICDSIDNNCNGVVDESPVSIAWYPDNDGDLFGAPDPTQPNGGVVISCMPVEGLSTRSSDCDDTPGGAQVHPGARELCNGVDDDCNGTADAGSLGPGDTEDDDGDQYADVSCGGSDCDDATADVNPDAPELCNMRDDNCDTVVDGGGAMAMWYLDLDRDGYGDSTSPPITSCEPQAARVPRAGDCDDDDASIHPRVPDPCNTGFVPIDEDCDGSFDENGIRFAFFPDADGDAWGESDPMAIVFACTRPAGTADRPGDCFDTDATRHPEAPELCQGIDDDCDALIDEDSDQNWYVDADRDGHGAGTPILQCTAPAGRVTLGDDCDDGDAGNFPTNAELCNGQDDDCDSMVDDGAAAACSGLAFSTGVCTTGACVLTCDAGHANCDGVVSSGCEVDTRRSPAYCGSCTNACGPGDTCGEVAAPGTCDRSPVVSLAGYNSHVFAVRATGGVSAWGDATTYGVTTSGTDSAEPIATPLTGIALVETSDDSSCAVTTGRRVLCWGYNNSGELGDGTTFTRASPREVVGISDAIDVGIGLSHACALHADGTVSCWGANNNGELGTGAPIGSRSLVPATVVGISDAVEIYVGNYHTCALRGASGARFVTCWGANTQGECGLGSLTPSDVSTPGANVVALPPDITGLAHGSGGGTCARTSGGQVYCWGYNPGIYSLGLGSSVGSQVMVATLMPGMTSVVEIALASNGGCLRRTGSSPGPFEVWCWGYHSGGGGLAGVDGVTSSSASLPRRAGTAATPIDDATAIAVGNQVWCAARASGGVTCMGSDYKGVLGNGLPATDTGSPQAVLNLP